MHTGRLWTAFAFCLIAAAVATAMDLDGDGEAIARSIEEMHREEATRETLSAREIYLLEQYPTPEDYARIAPPQVMLDPLNRVDTVTPPIPTLGDPIETPPAHTAVPLEVEAERRAAEEGI